MMLTGQFEAFAKEDFEVYSANKASLPLYNSKRFSVYKKLESISDVLKDILIDLNFDISHPSPSVWNNNSVTEQVLYFIKKDAEKKKIESFLAKELTVTDYFKNPFAYHNHSIIGVKVENNGFWIYIHLNKDAVIDYKNLKNKTEDENLFKSFCELLIEKDGYLNNETISSIDSKILRKNIKTIINDSMSFSYGYFYSKDSEIISQESFIEIIKNDILKLKPVFDFINWSSDNDYIFAKKSDRSNSRTSAFKEGDVVSVTAGFFEGKKATVVKISNNNILVDINGIQIKIDASELARL